MFSKTISLLQEFSIPLILGVILSVIGANYYGEDYHHWMEIPLLGEGIQIFGHPLTFHFLMNDIFMVFFFGIAAVEIAQAVSSGGSLNPISRAINPLMGTLGGVVGPVTTYFLLCYLFNVETIVYHGWGIPTATDIALAWLAMRFIFGRSHPAVSFLILLAVADDAIGLAIIAVFYPDPQYPVEWPWLLLIAVGMLCSLGLRRSSTSNFWWYLLLGGIPSWLGLILAHLHPALALVFIVPFMPGTSKDRHKELFYSDPVHSTRSKFEHTFKVPVDIGLFGFGLANAGVPFADVSVVTWIVFLSLFLGKTLGITFFSYAAHCLGLKLPQGMGLKHLVSASMVAGLGLTVALFMAGEAFTSPEIQGAAKMGALFSVVVVIPAWLLSRLLGIQKKH